MSDRVLLPTPSLTPEREQSRLKAARESDWRTEPLPQTRTLIKLDRAFSNAEISHLRCGFLPVEMEDKWFIYWQDDTLFFHRSWTGFCVYVAHFHCIEGEWRLVGAEVNGDPEQYHLSSDHQETKMINYLIDLLLLRREVSFPSEGCSPEDSAIKAWSSVGRAMFGQFPDDESSISPDRDA
jgi:hypothetical protein